MQVREVTRTWITGEGNAAKTQVTAGIQGTVVGLTIIISSVTDNPTVAVTFRDADGCIIIPDAAFAALTDGTSHIFFFLSEQGTQDATENPVPVMGPVTVSITPSADAGGSAQTLTVKVRIFARED